YASRTHLLKIRRGKGQY
ncbi:transglutaminase-like superfamily protein, partial [Chlamydia psittaci 84-8471/1]